HLAKRRVEAAHRVARILERLPRVADLVAVVPANEEEAKLLAALDRIELVEDLARREEVAERLRHLLRVDVEECAVHPVAGEGYAGCALALGDLVLVVRKLQVPAAAVDVESRAELA